jgi:predicted DsbA family dithiol-disulfide isomerase
MDFSLATSVTIDIWSDIICPFCYLGFKKLEKALQDFPHAVSIQWHSFQLYPDLIYQSDIDTYDIVAKMKGKSRDWSLSMHHHVVEAGKSCDIDFRFDKAKVANSFDAHRLIHYATQNNKGNEMAQCLFHAYFTLGKNISDCDTLISLGKSIGLDSKQIKNFLKGNDCIDEVNADIQIAQHLGIQGVPFFIINQKYALSGAQEPEIFLDALYQALK